MKFAYKFSNLLGTVYHKGNLLFTPDGSTVISPVGNRITLYDLKNNTSETLPIESRYNFTTLALAPNGCTLIAVNEPGEALLCSLISRTVIHRFHFKRPIRDIKFSPDGKHFTVTKENKLFLYRAPGSHTKEYNPFVLEKVYHFSYDETTCIDWTSDSRIVAVGGKDMAIKIYAIEKFENFSVCTLGSHTDVIVSVFFEDNSLDMYTVSKNGQVCVWDCSIDLESLIPKTSEETDTPNQEASDEEDDVQNQNKGFSDFSNRFPDEYMHTFSTLDLYVTQAIKKQFCKEVEQKDSAKEKTFYKRVGRHFIKDVFKKEGYVTLSAAAYHKKTGLLVAGFSNGSFLLYEMPECNLIHSLSISSQIIASIAFNYSGDWIAMGCAGLGQLVVWEWQSESFVLKQQGHFNNMHCLSYSPDGMYIATGGEDAKVKIWNTSTGFCFVTFTEHSGSITGVVFTQQGKAVLSSSLDGTVRAFDLKRYRNFRTFTSPRPTQFACVTVDPSGEIICAGSPENFEIFVWGMRTGRLLTILAGHEAPVSSISFSPLEPVMVSVSWDKTVRIWDVFENKGSRETITQISDGLAVTFRPDGLEIAVATLDGQISFFNVHTTEQVGYIEGRNDLYVGRKETDLITAKKLLKSQAFTTLCYTADGECILAAGKSKYICIYHVAEQILLKKFEVTCNLSFDAVEDFINRRRMTEFGNKALIEEREEEASVAIALPGSRKEDKSSRIFKPQIKVSSVQFSPTGRAWAATTTEGLCIYSLDGNIVFDPFDLDLDVTPANIRKTLQESEFMRAIMMALRLNEQKIITEVLESIPPDCVKTLSAYLPLLYVERLLKFIAGKLATIRHLEFYLIWVNHLLMIHGTKLKERSLTMVTTLVTLQRHLVEQFDILDKTCENNKYYIEYILASGEIKKRKAEDETSSDAIMNGVEDDNSSDGYFEQES